MADERDPVEDPRLAEVVEDLRAAFLTDPDEAVATRHLDQLYAAARVAPLRRRNRLATVVAAGSATAILFGLTGVAAAHDALPEPLQRGVAAVAGVVGIDVPDGDEDEIDRRPAGTPPPEATTPSAPEATPPVVDPGRSEEAPGHGGEIPGREETAPGQTGSAGETNNAPEAPPGQTGDQGNAPEVPPGQGDNPSQTAPSQTAPSQTAPSQTAPGRDR